MGSDDLFKKRREDRKRRRYEYKKPRANSYLIVTEGEKTEPLYFKGMKKLIQEKIGGMVHVAEIPLIDIQGQGTSTERLIEIAGMTGAESWMNYFSNIIWEMGDMKRIVRIFMKSWIAFKALLQQSKMRNAEWRNIILEE